MTSRVDAAGFSLLEVLVAFVILTLSITLLFQAFGTSTRNSRLAQEHLQAITLAESMMARMTHDLEMQKGELQGEFNDKYRWSRTVTEVPLGLTPIAGDDLADDFGADEETPDVDLTDGLGTDEEVTESDDSPDPEELSEADEPSTRTPLSSVLAYRIDLTVVWGPTGTHRVTLTSLRLVEQGGRGV